METNFSEETEDSPNTLFFPKSETPLQPKIDIGYLKNAKINLKY